MTLRKGHGSGAGSPRIEVLCADEQPAAVPAPADAIVRRQDGTLADSDSARRLGARGGAKRARNARLVAGLGISRPPTDSPIGPYIDEAERALAAQAAALATEAGGDVGPMAASVLATSAVQLAMSRWLLDEGVRLADPDLVKRGSALGDASRQNLLAARELAVRAAQARAASTGPADPLAAHMTTTADDD